MALYVRCGQYKSLCHPIFDFPDHFSSSVFCQLQRLPKHTARNFDDFVADDDWRCDYVVLGKITGLGKTTPLNEQFVEMTERIREEEAEILAYRLRAMKIKSVRVCVHCCENETLDEVAMMLAPFLPLRGFTWDAVRENQEDKTNSYMVVRCSFESKENTHVP